jgi:dienelactone hydrolase
MVSYKYNSEVQIKTDGLSLVGDLRVPTVPIGIIVFAHGSGSSRKSPRNRHVARGLNEAGFATLLFDLLTAEEEIDRTNVFNVPLLGERLVKVSDWFQNDSFVKDLSVGYFGASTGAAAALYAAAKQNNIFAVVCRGGRPDLASAFLRNVDCPVLLIVGGKDLNVIDMNQEASLMLGDCQIEIIPGAGHLFEEEGKLDEVIELVKNWFEIKLYSYRSGNEEFGNAFA